MYILIFFLSSYMIYLMSKETKKERKVIKMILAIMLPCLLAAFRAESIGTDVTVYITTLVEAASNADSFLGFYNSEYWHGTMLRDVSEIEIGLLVLIYILQSIFNNLYVVLFAIQLFITCPIYLGLCKMEKKGVNSWIGVLIFNLMYFNTGLNMMRQMMAMAIIFYFSQYLFRKQYFKFMVGVLVAALFHITALIAIIIGVIHYLLSREECACNKANIIIGPNFWMFTIIIGSLMALMLKGFAVEFMNKIGMSYYANYIDGALGLQYGIIIRLLPILVLVLVGYCNVKNVESRFFICMCIITIIINQLTNSMEQAGRIGDYFLLYMILPLSSCKQYFSEQSYKIVQGTCVCYALIYWIIYYVIKGWSETVPYILNI